MNPQDPSSPASRRSLTGYSNDLVHEDRAYHVLTEDLGEGHGVVVTHTFSEGSILDTRRSSYPRVREGEDRSVAIKRLMQEQHKQALRALVSRRPKAAGGAQRQITTQDLVPTEGLALTPPQEGARPPAAPHWPGDLDVVELVAPARAALLECVEGPRLHERLALYASPLTLGASGTLAFAHLREPDSQVLLRCDARGWSLTTSARSTPVTVDGQVTAEARLGHGAVLGLAGATLRFLEVHQLGGVLRVRRADDTRPETRVASTLLPLLQRELWSARSPSAERMMAAEAALAALAHVGPTITPPLFDDHESRLAYALNALVALTILGAWRGDPHPRRPIDGRSLGLPELDRMACASGDPRVWAATAHALRAHEEVCFTAEDLEAQLDTAMEAMVNDPEQTHVDHAQRRVILRGDAWPFLGALEEAAQGSALACLRRFGGPRRGAELARAEQGGFEIVFVE